MQKSAPMRQIKRGPCTRRVASTFDGDCWPPLRAIAYVNDAVVVRSSRAHVEVSVTAEGDSTRVSHPEVTQVSGGWQWRFTGDALADLPSGTVVTFYYKTAVEDAGEKKLSCRVQ